MNCRGSAEEEEGENKEEEEDDEEDEEDEDEKEEKEDIKAEGKGEKLHAQSRLQCFRPLRRHS